MPVRQKVYEVACEGVGARQRELIDGYVGSDEHNHINIGC